MSDEGEAASWVEGRVARHGLVLHELRGGELGVLSVSDESMAAKMGVQPVQPHQYPSSSGMLWRCPCSCLT
jgi:hypothetical protein